MDYISIFGISVGLAMDAFAVSVSNGALSKNVKISYAVELAFFFGIFQSVMPIVGWSVGKIGEDIIKETDHWVAFGILSIIGIKMIWDYIDEIREKKTMEKHKNLSINTIVVLAIATSIDALATGIILPSAVGAGTFYFMFQAVSIIGVVTFIISFCGVYLGKLFGYVFSKYSNLFGGVVLFITGGKILIEHLFF